MPLRFSDEEKNLLLTLAQPIDHGTGLRGVPAGWKGAGQPAAADGQLALN